MTRKIFLSLLFNTFFFNAPIHCALMDLMDQIIDLLMTAKMGRIGENLQRHFRLLHFSLSLSLFSDSAKTGHKRLILRVHFPSLLLIKELFK